jgi:preprotein translocase subunit SecA
VINTKKILKVLWPIVDEINGHYETIKNLTDDELKNKTKEFKEKIQTHTEETRKQIAELKTRLQSDEDFDRNAAYDELART